MDQSTPLEQNLTDFLPMNDDESNTSISTQGFCDEFEDEDENENDLTAAILAESDYVKSNPQPDRLSDPLQSAPDLKLVSAIKGSREKQGIPARSRNVNWADDVYDPEPTAGTLVPRSNAVTIHQRVEKKMNKQKPSTKTGKGKWKGKDKKQVKKYGGSSNKCFNSIDDDYCGF